MSEGRFAVDLASIAELTNAAEVTKLLNDVIREERAIDTQLEEMLERRTTFQELLLSAVQESDEVLEVIHTDAEQLLNGVQKASVVAEGISHTVKALDTTQSNVTSALDHIKLLTDRSSCVRRLRDSMEKRDYETAAECIAQFHALENELSQLPEPHQKQMVEENEAILLNQIREQLNSAVQKDASEDVFRFAKLFLPLKQKEEGYRALSGYLKSLVGRSGHDAYQKLSAALEANSQSSPFVERLSDLLRFVAVTIQDYEKVFVDEFGRDAAQEMMVDLYCECDLCGARILKRFLEARNVKRMVQDVALYRKKDQSSGAAMSGALDPRSAEKTLLEMLGLVRRCEEYDGLILQKLQDVAHPRPVTPAKLSKLQESETSSLSRQLSEFYVILEEFYMAENIKKAISIDAPISGSLVTSMVDDVFFICRKSASRAISSKNVPCVCAILSLLHSLLSEDYFKAVQKPKSTPTAFIQSLLSEEGLEEASQFHLFINNLQVSLNYVTKLKAELEQRVDDAFQGSNENEIVVSLLDDMGAMAATLERLMGVKISTVCDAMMAKLHPIFQEMTSMDYQINEQAYEQLAEVETWSHHILALIRRFASRSENVLTPENHSQVLDQLLQSFVSRSEAQFMQKSFNQLGGLQFDRDIRLLLTHFSEIYQSSVRDKFARLTQMATILCFESVEEMLDYWGDEGESIEWKLSPAEIKSILRLRSDFSESNVSALLL